MPKPTLSTIESQVKDFFENYPTLDLGIKNTRWVGEDGQEYSSWDISTPRMNIHTGDGGAELMIKTLKEKLCLTKIR